MKINIRETVGEIYFDSVFAKKIITPLKKKIKAVKYNKISDRKYTENRYYKLFNEKISLDNPQTFNEKIQWLKLNDRSKLHTQCADKFEVRKIVADEIGEEYLIPLYFVTKDWRDIVPDNIPDNCVIKCNHDSMNVVIVTSAEELDFDFARRKMRGSLRRNFYYRFREWQYKDIEPKVIVEKLIKDDAGKLPKDYKFFCFDGKCKYILVDSDRFGSHKRDVYDLNWKRLPVEYRFENSPVPVKRPNNLEKMIELAEKLAAPFPFVRVDLYDTGSKIYFGEITFHPGAGFSPIKPKEWQYIWGRQIPLRLSGTYEAFKETQE